MKGTPKRVISETDWRLVIAINVLMGAATVFAAAFTVWHGEFHAELVLLPLLCFVVALVVTAILRRHTAVSSSRPPHPWFWIAAISICGAGAAAVLVHVITT